MEQRISAFEPKTAEKAEFYCFSGVTMKIKIKYDNKIKTVRIPDARSIGKTVREDAKEFSKASARLMDEIRAVRERDPAAKTDMEVLTLYSGVHATLAYRLAHRMHDNGFEYCSRFVSQAAKALTGIEIHPGAEIGKELFIDHGSGVVIGETAIIGDGCTLYQGVTLGGTGKDEGKRHPTLGNNVMVGAGAKILGPVNIGDNSKIAAGAVVLTDIPANCTAVGIPARIVRKDNARVEPDLDQIHIPDPVEKEFAALRAQIDELREKVDKQPAAQEKV